MSKKKAQFFKGTTELPPVDANEKYLWNDVCSLLSVGRADTIKEDYSSGFGGWRLRFNTGEVCGVGKTDTTVGVDGDICLKLSGSGGNALTHLYIQNTIIGHTYRFKFWAKSGIGTDQRYGGISMMNNDGEWNYYEYDRVADGTSEDILFYTSRTSSTPSTMYISNFSVIEIAPTGYDTDTQAFIDAVNLESGVTLTSAQEVALDDLVVGLKNNGTWSKYYAIYPFIGGTANSHKWNLKDPQDLDSSYRIVWGGTITHDALGVKSDGTTGYGNTKLAYNVHGSTNFGMGAYIQEEIEGNSYLIGSNSFGQAIRLDNKTGSVDGFLTQFSNAEHDGTFVGMLEGHRLNSTDHRLLKNGVTVASDVTDTTPSPSSLETYFLCWNNNGVPNNFADEVVSYLFISQGLTDAECLSNNTLIENYQTALGRKAII